ncbi:MAG: hypothetical protein FJW39_31970 [Acidobacteria bacterium]|nr:hypothetical protein [Acidobacteriota bacterium]
MAIVLLGAGQWSGATEFLPLMTGNSWTLASQSGSTMTLTVTSSVVIGPVRRANLYWQTPWGNSLLIVRTSPVGVEHEGLVLDDASTHFASPMGLFMEGPKGSSWTSQFGFSSLVDDDATVETRTWAYRGVRRYFVAYSETQHFHWFLARGVGFVQFGDGDGKFLLTSSRANAEPEAVAAKDFGPCPLPGIDANPAADLGSSVASYEAAMLTAVAGGSRYADIPVTWKQLEPQPGVYEWSKLIDPLWLATVYNMDVSVTLKTANTTGRELPADLVGRAWNDPVVLDRWSKLMTAVVARLNARVQWLNLANEVDFYFFERPGEIPAFREFFRTGDAVVQKLRPGLSTGLVFAHDSVRYTDRVFHQLNDLGRHVGFTYYNLDGIKARSPREVAIDFPWMVHLAGGKPVIITEFGYTSSPEAGGGPDEQRAFFINSFDALYRLSGKVRAARVFQMSDLPGEAVVDLARSLGQGANLTFVAHLGSLGIFHRTGVPKPAWDVFRHGAAVFSVPNACLVPPVQP